MGRAREWSADFIWINTHSEEGDDDDDDDAEQGCLGAEKIWRRMGKSYV